MLYKRVNYVNILTVLLVCSQVFQDITAKELGEECARSEECQDGASGDLSICGPENICICNDLSVPNTDNTTCFLKATTIGDPCTINTQCTEGSLGNQSYCDLLIGQVCKCNLITSIPNAEANKCLPVRSTIGAPCEESGQCQRGVPGFNSICKKEDDTSDEGTCQCDEYSVTVPGQHICLQIRNQIGEQCSANIQCTVKIGDLSECQLSSRTCQCKENEAIGNYDQTKCLNANVLIGQPCEETTQCVGMPNSVCSTSKRCDCIIEFVPSSPLDDCLPVVNQLGRECQESQQCSSGIPGSLSACIENQCRCTVDATSGENEHVCRKVAMYVGDTCGITAQCTVNLEHSFCQENKCVCLSGAVASGDGMKCLLKAYLGEECSEDNQCSHVEHSVCSVDMKTCQCRSGYTSDPSGTRCVLENDVLKVGQPCTRSSICPGIPGISSGCSESGYCGCLEGFVQSQDLDDCVPIRNSLGDNCMQNHQCQLGSPGKFSACLDDTCNCSSSAINKIGGNICYRKAILVGDGCLHQEQCVANLGSSFCMEKKCECFDGYKMSFDHLKCIKE